MAIASGLSPMWPRCNVIFKYYRKQTRLILAWLALFVLLVGLKIGFVHALGIVFMACATIVVCAGAYIVGWIEGWW